LQQKNENPLTFVNQKILFRLIIVGSGKISRRRHSAFVAASHVSCVAVALSPT